MDNFHILSRNITHSAYVTLFWSAQFSIEPHEVDTWCDG